MPSWLSSALGVEPMKFVDVGARGGWPRKWRPFEQHTVFIGFEPDRDECERLRAAARSNEIYVDQGLYREVGVVDLFHCDPPSRTSIYKPDAAVMARVFGEREATKVVRVEQIPVTTLDRALESLSIGSIDYIKLDTQGSELDILQGAVRTLADTVIGIEVEVEFVPVYENQPLFPDVAAFLRDHAFEFVDFAHMYSAAWVRFGHRGARGYAGVGEFVANWASLTRPGGGLRGGARLVYADAVFLREPGAWLAAVRRHGQTARAHALRGLTAACVSGYYEYALEIAQLLRREGLIEEQERVSIEQLISDGLRSWWRAKDDLVRLGHRLVHRLQHLGAAD